MRNYILRRLLLLPFMLVAMSAIIFYLLQVRPGDAAILRIGATGNCQECVDKLREDLGLDRPPVIQYLDWLGGVVTGDFGKSLGTEEDIGAEIGAALPKTLELAFLTILMTLLIGIPIGVISAVKQGSAIDYSLRFFSIMGLSIPGFWLGTLLITMPLIWWGWTPLDKFVSFGEDPLKNLEVMFWPSLVLAVASSAYVARLVRSSMLETLYSDHVRTARAKGLRENVVILRHVFRASLVTILTLVGIQFGTILGGSVLIEQIFGIAGLGRMSIQAVTKQDYISVLGVTIVYASLFILVTLLIDILYAYVDPRIRY